MILWPWDNFVRPIRSYFARRKRSRWKEKFDRSICPSCKLPFDNGRKRCVVDSCGHHRCYACLCIQDVCPVCSREKSNEDFCANKRTRISVHSAIESTDYQSLDVFCENRYSKRFSKLSNLSSEVPFDETILTLAEKNITLKPLYFEVPQSEANASLLYRSWLIKELTLVLSSNARGVVLVGDEGSGKTFLSLQLVDWSCFGRKHKSNSLYAASGEFNIFEKLASRVVGYHFCQTDCKETCRVPDFVHSLAAQLCQAPQLVEYRNFLLRDESYQELLSLDTCIENPDRAFQKGILEPLGSLSKYQVDTGFLIIDSVHEAEAEGHSRSIASFLAKHISQFPLWLKIVMSVSSESVHIVSPLNLHRINLKCSEVQVRDDLLRYIHCRIKEFPSIQANISATGDERQISRFAEHLISGGQASFLYAKLILDLLQQNHLVVKSSTFNVIPVSLDEVFTLIFNLRFPSAATFSKIKMILEICLASASPLSAVEIFYASESASVTPTYAWHGFTQSLQLLSGILVQRNDASLMLFHPALRRWLTRNKKFLCDIRSGHTYLALLSTRLRQRMSNDKALEFLFHLSRCDLFDKEDRLKAVWMHQSPIIPSTVLAASRILYQPDEQVIRLLLESGTDPNLVLENVYKDPILGLASKLGFVDIVRALLYFGSDSNKPNALGVTPLMEATIAGHLQIIEILLDANAKVNHQDKVGRCALSIAAEKGHVNIVDTLLKQKSWLSPILQQQAIQRALIAAAGIGNIQMCELLLRERESPEKLIQELKSAYLRGQKGVCELILENSSFGHNNLHLAAARGHITILQILLSKGVKMDSKDEYGRTALSWACIYRQYEAARFLLEAGADITIKDAESDNALQLAAKYGDAQLVTLIMNYDVTSELKNSGKKTPLACAISAKNVSSTLALLQGEVKIDPEAFECARNQPKFCSILLNKLLNDGLLLFKKGNISEARRHFEHALDKTPQDGNFHDIRCRLQEYLSRCQIIVDNKKKEQDEKKWKWY